MAFDLNGFAENELPSGRRGNGAQHSKPWECRRDGDMRHTDEMREGFDAAQQGHGFFPAEDGARDDGCLGTQAKANEAAATKSLELVFVFEQSSGSLGAFGKDGDEPFLLKKPLRVVLACPHGSHSIQKSSHERHVKPMVFDEPSKLSIGGKRFSQRGSQHDPIVGKCSGVIGDDQGATAGGDMVSAFDLDAKVAVMQEVEQGGEVRFRIAVITKIIYSFRAVTHSLASPLARKIIADRGFRPGIRSFDRLGHLFGSIAWFFGDRKQWFSFRRLFGGCLFFDDRLGRRRHEFFGNGGLGSGGCL